MVDDPALLVRGSADEIERFTQRLDDPSFRDGPLGLGVLGNPLSDFPGLPALLRALEARGITTRDRPGRAARDAFRLDRDAAGAAPAAIRRTTRGTISWRSWRGCASAARGIASRRTARSFRT